MLLARFCLVSSSYGPIAPSALRNPQSSCFVLLETGRSGAPGRFLRVLDNLSRKTGSLGFTGGSIRAKAADHYYAKPSSIHRQTTTGMDVCANTLVVTLPSTMAAMPVLPWEAMTMRSQPLSFAVATMDSKGRSWVT